MKKLYLIFLLIALLAIAGCGSKQPSQPSTPTTQSTGSTEHIIKITADGFSPSTLTINQGDEVTWTNEDTKDSWPASAQHPTHTAYPGSGIEKCGTSEQSTIFDACHGLKPGGSWSFTFNEKGTWSYHDHINFPGPFGKIIVQ